MGVLQCAQFASGICNLIVLLLCSTTVLLKQHMTKRLVLFWRFLFFILKLPNNLIFYAAVFFKWFCMHYFFTVSFQICFVKFFFLRFVLFFVVVITFYSPSFPDQETLSFSESSCHLHTTHGGGFTLALLMLNVQAGELNNRWFDPTGNRTRVYHFSSRRSFHSTTDQFWNA